MPPLGQAEVRKSPLGGRGLFATKLLKGRDVILELDRPLVTVLDQARAADTCAWCFSWTELPILSGAGVNQALKVSWCTGCKKVKYCSTRCQSQAWKAGHKQLCKKLAAAPDVVPTLVDAVMQALRGLESGDALYAELRKMETHRDEFEKIGGKKWETMQFMSHTALKLLGMKDDQTNLELAKMVICVIVCNTLRLVTLTFDPLGLALDPRVSVINHSCRPNAVVVFDGPKLAVKALENISADKEVFISYIDSSGPFGVRQAELKDQYFFDCLCEKCKLGQHAPQDAFLKRTADFEQKISVIDDMIPKITSDPAWPRHKLGDSADEKRLSALQFYGYSFLDSPDQAATTMDPSRTRKAIAILRNTGVWPVTRAPLPALYQHHAVACLSTRRYNEGLVAMIRLHILIDPVLHPQEFHPVRVVHAWTLATLAKAVSSDPDAPFCKALQACGVDLPILFLALLGQIHTQVGKSHGAKSMFAAMVDGAWHAIMGPGGDLETQYLAQGVSRQQQRKILQEQIEALWPKLKAFAADDAVAAQIDEALAE